MKNYKILLISFVLFFFILGAVSAADANSTDDTVALDDEIEVGGENLDLTSEVVTEEASSEDQNPPLETNDIDEENQEPLLEANDVKEIYVNDTGDDSNTGSINSPYYSIGKAISEVSSDKPSTIYLNEGTFGKDNDTNFFLDPENAYFDNCNVTFIGAGSDKTFIDGQSASSFMNIIYLNSYLTFKDITFINFRSGDAGVVTGILTGSLNIDNCIFKNIESTGSSGVINYIGQDLTITNSQFINCIGGAIITENDASYPGNLYLENNTFINITKARNKGVAISSTGSKTQIRNNRFINITGGQNQDASLYIRPSSNDDFSPVITDNTFINCNTPSAYYASAVLFGYQNTNFTFERNNFVNSSNANGDCVLLDGRMFNLNITMSNEEIKVGKKEIDNGIDNVIVNVTDDMGNFVSLNSPLFMIFVGENGNYSPEFFDNFIYFESVPENGIYDLVIVYNDGLSSTGVLTTVNVSVPTGPYDIYVSPNGSDANNGSLETPFKTIQHAIDSGFEKSFHVVIHLLEGRYAGDDNVNLNIADKGTLEIVGEYNKTIIDGERTNWFMHVSECNVEAENLTFINGAGTGHIISGQTLHLKNCIVDNCEAKSNKYVLYYVTFDNLVYTNNTGSIYYRTSRNISDSYFANNKNIYDDHGILYLYRVSDIVISNCKFINNTATNNGGVIYTNYQILSKNNYYANNKAKNYGVFYLGSSSNPMITCENDTFISNSAIEKYGVGNLGGSTLIDCKFINNTAATGGVANLIFFSRNYMTTSFSTYVGCSFINNSAEYGGVFELPLVMLNKGETITDSVKFDNVIFENNNAVNGKDIYLNEKGTSINSVYYDYVYPIDLTVTFNNMSVTSLSDVVSAGVEGADGIQIGGGNIAFMINNVYIGSSEIINGVAALTYDGFKNGNLTLSGNLDYPSANNIINNATLTVNLEGVVDHIDFWVSNTGSDETGDGSENNPFKTIQHAIDKAYENCRDITIYLGEETYSGENNTNLTLSSVANIMIKGKGMGKTVIDGQNNNSLAKVLIGENKVTFSDLTIINMAQDNRADLPIGSSSPMGIHSIIKADSFSPIVVDYGATLCLDNVNITECQGGNAIVDGEGNVFIYNSIFYKIGVATGIIKCENLVIDNSVIDQCLVGGYPIRATNVLINNSEIKDVFNIIRNGYYLISGAANTTIENTKVLINSWENPLDMLGIDGYDSQICIASVISSQNTFVKNSAFKNEFNLVYPWQSSTDYSWNDIFSGTNVNVYNSSFEGYKFIIWSGTGVIPIYNIDGCIFNNITNIFANFGANSANISFTNSVLILKEMNIVTRVSISLTLEDNYWGNNSQPVILDNRGNALSPSHWIILVSEGDEPVFKLTDGENVTDYSGSLPAKISYVADETGEVIPVLNLAGTGYKFNVDEKGNIVLNTTSPMKNIVPKVLANETVFADDVTLLIGESVVFTANFTDKWGDALKNTNVSFIVNGEINTTTNENGSASFTVDFGLGKYTVTITNPVTDETIFRTISITTNDTVSANDVTSVYGDGSKFSAVFTDEFGKPLANTNVTFTVGDNNIAATTDDNGTATFSVNFDAGNYNVTIINPVTGQNITKALTVKKIATKLTAAKVTTTYNVAKDLVITLKDANGKALANVKVVVKIDGKQKEVTTDKDGNAKYAVNLPAKKYTATITFNGDDNYLKSTATAEVVVNKANPKLTAKKKTFKTKTKKYTVTLKDNKGKAMKKVKVTLTTKVKGKKVKLTVKTNKKGKATFNLKKLTKKGKYTAKVKFAGNKNFKAVTKKAKITVKK